MSLVNSLLAAAILMTIVFIVLALLFSMLKLQTLFFNILKKNLKDVQTGEKVNLKPMPQESSSGELELIGVDERTAAMVMALASYELNIPLEELQFKSIKALD